MEPAQVVVSVAPSAPPMVKDDGPLPMSFPAVLRNPGLSDRFAHLRMQQRVVPKAASAKSNKRDDKEGKRWVRRKENARFVGNVHIVVPTTKDYSVPVPNGRTTFPEPLPHYLSRNNPIPPAVPAAREPASANAGQFSMSLRGMRKELRRAGPRTELLVREVEREMTSWLSAGGVMLSPDAPPTFNFPGQPIGSSDAIMEVSRTPLQLVWSIADDAYTRYIVHCCARYHEVVSFSKETSGQRLTYILRPNVTRPTPLGRPSPDTPPVTDLSELSTNDFDTESDMTSDHDTSDVDADISAPVPAAVRTNDSSRGLSSIAEVGSDASTPSSPAVGTLHLPVGTRPPASLPDTTLSDDAWSVLGESDIEGDTSAVEGSDLVASVASLALTDDDSEHTPQADARRRQGPDALRSRLLQRQCRSASSPSRSPARKQPHRLRPRIETLAARRQRSQQRKSFHDFLFT